LSFEALESPGRLNMRCLIIWMPSTKRAGGETGKPAYQEKEQVGAADFIAVVVKDGLSTHKLFRVGMFPRTSATPNHITPLPLFPP
jgi:hypothetical protein